MTTSSTALRRRLASAAFLIAAGAATATMAAPMADAAQAQYVAIAYSPVDNFSGLSIHTNLDTAIAGALSRCGTEAGHCQLVAWSENGCAALAVNGDQYYGWYGSNYAEAQNGALQRAGGGRIMQSQCINR